MRWEARNCCTQLAGIVAVVVRNLIADIVIVVAHTAAVAVVAYIVDPDTLIVAADRTAFADCAADVQEVVVDRLDPVLGILVALDIVAVVAVYSYCRNYYYNLLHQYRNHLHL